MLIIRREGMPSAERAVKIVRREDGKFWWVNPRSQVARATGCGVGRHNCIQSFAQGLQHAGHRVMIDDKRVGYHPKMYEFTRAATVTYIYWLVGYAWGLDKWEELVLALQSNVRQDRWFAALEATAKHSYRYPWQPLELVLPIA